jgi:hypothetical protein
MKTTLRLPLALALAAVLSASPALAQNGNGQGKKNERARQEQLREDRRDRDDDDDDRWDRDDDDRRDRDRDYTLRRRDSRRVPPGWCIGRGNPHNTRENCGRYSRRDGRYDGRRSDDRRYDDRRYSRSGSYTERHRAFHAYHDRQCRERAAQRGDVIWKLRVAAECREAHDAWHRREGTRH